MHLYFEERNLDKEESHFSVVFSRPVAVVPPFPFPRAQGQGPTPEIRGTRCIRITTHYTPVSSPSLRSTALACGKMDGTRLTVLRCSSTGRICWRHNEDLEYIIIYCNFVSTLLIEIRERWIEKFLFPRKRREV